MTIDQNEFFREATLRICGDLRLERALHSTLLYLRKYMPLDLLFAEHLDPDQGAARSICTWHSTAGPEIVYPGQGLSSRNGAQRQDCRELLTG